MSLPLPPFLADSFRRHSPCFLRRVPLNILVNDILLLLSVKELLRLRQVDKAFCILTHDVAIWKHLFHQLDIPTPVFYESPNTFGIDAKEFEYERMVARSTLLDDNWRDSVTKAYDVRTFGTKCEMLEMELLPGGRYLVASVRVHFAGVPLDYAIAIYNLELSERPVYFSMCALGRPYCLQAKYMQSMQPSIYVAYITKEYKYATDHSAHRALWEQDYEHDPDLGDIIYQWNADRVSLESLEGSLSVLGEPHQERTPIMQMRYSERVDLPALLMINDLPQAAYFIDSSLVIHNLISGATVTHILGIFDCDVHVRAFKLFPSMNMALVIRTRIESETVHKHFFHLFDLSHPGVRAHPFLSFVSIFEQPMLWFAVTNHPHMSEFLPGCNPSHGEQQHTPPISIYAVVESPRTLLHMTVLAVDPTATAPVYNITPESLSAYSCYEHDSEIEFIPAVHRPLMFNLKQGVVTDLRRYLPKACSSGTYERMPLVRRSWHETWQPTRMIQTVAFIPRNVYDPMGESCEVAWDEASGRACIAIAPNGRMVVVDMVKDLERNRWIDVWKKQRRAEGNPCDNSD